MHSSVRIFLAVLIGWLVAWFGGGTSTAQVPPPITRSVLTTNIPAFGTTGQALFRTTAGPYLNWSNIAGVIGGPFILSSNGYGSNTTFFPGVASSNYPPLVIYASAITNGLELLDSSSNLVMCITTNGRVLLPAGTNNFPVLGLLSQDDGTGTGLYFPSSSALDLSINGTRRFEITANGIDVGNGYIGFSGSGIGGANTFLGYDNSPGVTRFNAGSTTPSTNRLCMNNISTNRYVLEFAADRANDWFAIRSMNLNTGTDPTTNKPLALGVTTNWQMKFETNGDISTRSISSETTNGPIQLVRGDWSTNIAVSAANIAMTTATNFTRAYAQPLTVGTNLATGADQTIALDQDSTVSITNAVAGSVNIWFTNAVDRKWCVLRCVADGSNRTLSFTNASGLTINVIATNYFSVLTLPQCAVTANKIGTFIARVWLSAGTTNVDIFGNVQP